MTLTATYVYWDACKHHECSRNLLYDCLSPIRLIGLLRHARIHDALSTNGARDGHYVPLAEDLR